ncbi:Cell surface mannoprotein mp65 [Lecanora helva]
MKIGFFSLAAIGLLQFTIAQPHQPFWRRFSHRHHPKRAEESTCAINAAVVTSTATVSAAVTYDFEDVIVFVDDNNRPVSSTTSYRNLMSSTQLPGLISSPSTALASDAPRSQISRSPLPSLSPSATAPASSSSEQANSLGGSAAQPSQAEALPKPAPIKSSPAPLPSPSNQGESVSDGPGFKSGISYSPYNADNSCKSTQQVSKDLQQQASNHEVIRLYGTDCNQVSNVIAATKGAVKLFLGIFDINSIPNEVQTISSAISGNWGLVSAVSVGNELVNSGKASAGQVTAAIGTARSALKAAGYSGPVTTVDTMIAMKSNPMLCSASDFCAINCHAFFDGNVLPEGAGDFVKKWAQQVSDAAGGKMVVVTESGWPTQGGTNKKAIASQEAHTAAISSLKSAFGGGTNLILYGMYNDAWKEDSATTFGSVPPAFGLLCCGACPIVKLMTITIKMMTDFRRCRCERYWGLYGNAPS